MGVQIECMIVARSCGARSHASADVCDLDYDNKKRRTRRERFLERMDRLIPWDRLEARVAPDETTILNFRRRLEHHGLGRGLFEEINGHLAEHGVILRAGAIIDARIVAAPSAAKNKGKERDPEMHRTKKGNQWYFGMKLHIGVDNRLGSAHRLEGAAANVHDLTPSAQRLHGEGKDLSADAGCQGIEKRTECEKREAGWRIAMRPGKRRVLDPDSAAEKAEQRKVSVRAKVGHPFRLAQRALGYDKVRYRRLEKTIRQLALLPGFSNPMTAPPMTARPHPA